MKREKKSLEMDKTLKKVKRLLPFVGAALFAVAIYTLHTELSHMSFHDLQEAFALIPLSGVFFGLLAACANYILLSFNDMYSAWEIGVKLPHLKVGVISFVSNAIGFNLGASAISGGAVRYRLYSALGLDGTQVGHIVALNQLSMIFGPCLAGALAFFFSPDTMFSHFGWPQYARYLIAAGCALVPAAVLCAGEASARGHVFRIRDIKISVPRPRDLLFKFMIGFFDITTAALVLYAVLPNHGVPILIFISAFVVSMMAGTLSQVPGGLGVFDVTLMMLLSPFYHHADMFSAILLFRFIYYIIPFVCATVILFAVELSGKLSRYFGKLEFFLPDAAAVWTFMAGTWLLLSTAAPIVSGGWSRLGALLPLPLFEASHFIKSLTGTFLLFLAWGLAKRLKSAWAITLLTLFASLLFSLPNDITPFRDSFFLLLLVVLLFSRRSFYRLSFFSAPNLKWSLAIAAAAAAVIWWGFFAYRHVEYANDLWWTFTFDSAAPRFLRAAAGMSFTALLIFLFLWLRPSAPAAARPSRAEIKELVAGSYAADAALALLGDKKFFMARDRRSAVMYSPADSFWISMGDPIGKKDGIPELIWDFCEEADRRGAGVAFYETGGEWLDIYRDAGFDAAPIGEDARVDISAVTETLEGAGLRKLRSIKKHMDGEGLSFSIIDGDRRDKMLPKLRGISNEWLKTVHGTEKGFSLGFFEEDYLKNFPVAVAVKEGEPLAFCNLWLGGGDEFSVDLMRYTASAPRDIMTWLFIEAMIWGRAHGYRYFRLGMAPLSNLDPRNSLWERMGNFIYQHGEHFYNFKGLRQYKEKFQPEWQKRYIIYKDRAALPLLASQLVRLISKKHAAGDGQSG